MIMTFVCCIAVVALGKKHKGQNVTNSITQRVELQTIRSPETTQRTNQRGPSRPLPNTTFNTIPQRQTQYPGHVTHSANYPVANHRQPPLYNESSNTIGSHEMPTVAPYPYMSPCPQQQSPPYQQQAGHHLVPQPSSMYSRQPSAPPQPYESHAFNTLEMNQGREPNTSAEPYNQIETLRTLPPPSYADLFEN